MRDSPGYQTSTERHENHDEEPEVPAKDALGGRQGEERAAVIHFTLGKIYIIVKIPYKSGCKRSGKTHGPKYDTICFPKGRWRGRILDHKDHAYPIERSIFSVISRWCPINTHEYAKQPILDMIIIRKIPSQIR